MTSDLVAELAAAGVGPGSPLGVAVLPGVLGLAAEARTWSRAGWDPDVLHEVEQTLGPRWVWWRASTTASPLLEAGLRLRRCWDVAAVHRLIHGGHRDDPAAVWAGAHGRTPPPAPGDADPTLLDPVVEDSPDPIGADGDLHPGWATERWEHRLGATELARRAGRWAELALQAHDRQRSELRSLPDHRLAARPPHLAELTAFSESAAALLCVELAHDGLPVDLEAAGALLMAALGPRPADPADAALARARRDDAVLRHVSDDARVDLRNPAQVRTMLGRLGFDVPDTRSWRLEPFRDAHPAVAALLAWRKTERLSTTYGYGWIDRFVDGDRLRGEWGASDGGAGRMTASAGLHNMPVELRSIVAAEPGHVLVRADLGQVEPRVLAAVSHDRTLANAARDDDLYLPIAAALGCDRATAKVGMLAAMYGQTSGTAAAVLRRMDATYPDAMRYLRAAEEQGRNGGDVRTYGGRLVRGRPPGDAALGRYLRNAVVQGAAAELFKAWAAAVRSGLGDRDGRIVLCLHDELLVHVPEDRADDVAALLHSALGETSSRWSAGIDVRFVADVSVVRRWSEAKA